MLTEKEIRDYYAREDDLEAKIKTKEEEKQALYEANKEKADLKAKLQKKANNYKSLAVVFGLLTLTIFVGNILAIASPLIAILFVLLRLKPKKQLEVLLEDLKDYDSKVAEIDSEIKLIQDQLKTVQETIYRHLAEKRHAQHAKNHICIYVGKSSNDSYFDSEPHESASYYGSVASVNVYIDGVELGDIEKPYAAFEVTPGMHTVKIECYDHYADYPRQVVSKVERVNITNDSVYLFYHWTFYWKKDHLHDALFLKKFDNVYDFLESSKQGHL